MIEEYMSLIAVAAKHREALQNAAGLRALMRTLAAGQGLWDSHEIWHARRDEQGSSMRPACARSCPTI